MGRYIRKPDEEPPKKYIVGLDLSLRAAAVCAIPVGWDQNFGHVRTRVFGHGLAHDADEHARLSRLHEIADGIVTFCREYRTQRVFVEQYAFSQAMSHARSIAECGGVVKYRLFRKLGHVAEPIVAAGARKLLLQHLPRADVKKFVVRNVRRLEGSPRTWGEDEIDAFVIANAGLDRCGYVALSFPGQF